MLYRYLKVLLFFMGSLATYAQGETSNWFFGNGAGITFNNDGTVSSLSGGRINTFEGCASISDGIGNLLLYTDGITVYDRTHNVMQGGSGLYGDPSSTQSAIVVQKPQDPNILYIFTVDTSTFEGDPDRGLSYSVVDMTLNGGNGGITQRNVNLLSDCSEKITAVIKNCSEESIWVVTLGSQDGSEGPFNTYHAFEVSTAGVNTTSVKSTFPGLEILDPRGYLKFSADGKKLASANMAFGLQLYDFDNTTGMVSNQSQVPITAPNKVPYGLEFSPNQRFLYVHTSNNQPAIDETGHSSSLLQFDLTAPNVAASEIEIDRRPIYRGALQLAQNGKIYRTIAENYVRGTSYLGVIESPNELGDAANYNHNAVFLGSGSATQGLPPFIQSYFDRVAIIKNSDGTESTSGEICQGEEFSFEADVIPNATYEWEKDGNPIANTGNTLTISNADLTDAGRYSLSIVPNDASECPIVGEAFIAVNPLPQTPVLNLVQCDVVLNGPADGLTAFNLEEAIVDDAYSYSFYETLSDLNAGNAISNPIGFLNTTPFNQTIYYEIVDSNGCANSGELQLEIQTVVLDPSDEKTFYECEVDPEDTLLAGMFNLDQIRALEYPNDDMAFYATVDDAILEQNPISGNYLSEATTIFARLESGNECQDIDWLNLVVNPTPRLIFEEEILWCTDGPPLPIRAPDGFDSYQWFRKQGSNLEPISTQQDITIASLGTYSLEVGYHYSTNAGVFECYNAVDFEVLPSNKAFIEDIDVTDLADNNMVEVLVSGDGDYEFSLDGINYQDSALFENVDPGFLTLSVRDKNGCGITKQKTTVIGYPKFFTPNGDNINDTWQLIGINEEYQANSLISIYNRYGKLMALISPKTNGWNGTFNNNELPASDYWFKVNLEDERIYRGHFTLKR
ncbi:T9SS type B sorting domain-containing protein [Flagellimonas myxillae]|uniref:T9SS type B sorting domain-containing protein n=1 Tax=Flagellimonas myxillae TaxID=2942214 RepID=UPI00201FAF1E|nr:T9SS type B sorting domain-containing protein [Muricauda myxillae]MCL6265265.1 T9SS type B sorting domain-containing protein [Muricauda myxillae]